MSTIQKVIQQNDSVIVNLQWNGRPFAVEINEQGVVVTPTDKKGNVRKDVYPNVWVDPHRINTTEGDPVKEPLLLHGYYNNEQEMPATIELKKSSATVEMPLDTPR